jgi:hypothetical protein
LLLLAACGGSGTTSGSLTTPAPAPTPSSVPPTAAPTATVTPRPAGQFVCPTTVAGVTKTFVDPQLGLSFTYPAAWTENECQQLSNTFIIVGNLFPVGAIPRAGQTIAEWVNATKSADEVVTLTPLSAPYAVEAARVTVTFPNGTHGTPAAFQPFVQTLAIVAGPRTFFQVNYLLAQASMTDTMPPGGIEAKLQVIETFREL